MSQQASSIGKILSEAIYKEQSASDLYAALADRIQDPDGKSTFATLASDERNHRTLLEGWWGDRFGAAFAFDASKVKKIKVVVADQAGAMEALDLALDAERRAAEEYESLATSVSDPVLVKLTRELAEQEWGHFETLTAEKAAVADSFHWFDIDFAGHMED